MPTPALPGRLTGASTDLGVTMAILAAWVGLTLVGQWGNWPGDLAAVYVAGWFWDHGQPGLIYALPKGFFGGTPPEWAGLMAQIAPPEADAYAYIYPPVWAALAAPLTRALSAMEFFNLVALIQVPMLAASLWLGLRLSDVAGPGRSPRWPWVIGMLLVLQLSAPMAIALYQNQPTITVTFLTLLAFDRLWAHQPRLAGGLLALAAAIKLTPALFAILFLTTGQRRAFVSFCVTGVGLAAFNLGLTGMAANLQFIRTLSLASEYSLLSSVNLSLRAALEAAAAALGHGQTDLGLTNTLNVTSHLWISLVSAALLIAVPVLMARRLAPLTEKARQGAFLLTFAVAVNLFGPVGWQHYFLLPMFLAPSLFAVIPAGVAALIVIALSAIMSLWAFNFGHSLAWPAATYVWVATGLWCLTLAVIWWFRHPVAAGRPAAR